MTPEIYKKARAEIVALFGWDANNLSPDQTLRVDCATPIRLALDAEQGKVLRGETTDPSKMVSLSEAFARLLPPAVLAAPPSSAPRSDLREAFLRQYFETRRRAGISEYGSAYDAMRVTAIELAEEAERRSDTAAGRSTDVPRLVEVVPDAPAPAPASAANVLTLSRPPSATPAAPTESQYDYNASDEWKAFINPDGSVRPTPRGRWDV
jgi:hypothetical protein